MYINELVTRNFFSETRCEDREIDVADVIPLPADAFTEDARRFAAEVYRIFTHAFDYGTNFDALGTFRSTAFLAQVWAGNVFHTAAAIHKYRNITWLHMTDPATATKEDLLVGRLADIDDIHVEREAYFLEYAIEAAADAWCGDSPLTPEQIERIAAAALEYAVEKTGPL